MRLKTTFKKTTYMIIQLTSEATPYHQLKFIGDTNEAYREGQVYNVYMQKMLHEKRIRLYKMSSMHEPSGYKCYSSLSVLNKDFDLDEQEKRILSQILEP